MEKWENGKRNSPGRAEAAKPRPLTERAYRPRVFSPFSTGPPIRVYPCLSVFIRVYPCASVAGFLWESALPSASLRAGSADFASSVQADEGEAETHLPRPPYRRMPNEKVRYLEAILPERFLSHGHATRYERIFTQERGIIRRLRRLVRRSLGEDG